MEKQKIALKKLGLSDAEIEQVLADDKKIDKGEKLFSLSAEQEKISKQARQVNKSPTVYKLDNEKGKRSKKANPEKEIIISTVLTAIQNIGGITLDLINPEREFTFSFNDTKYKIVLSAPRK